VPPVVTPPRVVQRPVPTQTHVAPPIVVTTPALVAPAVVPATIAPVTPARDSAASGLRVTREDIARRSFVDAIGKRYIPTFSAPSTTTRAAAPMSPAGVTAHNAPLSPAARDSIITAKLAGAADWLSDKYKPTEEQVREHATLEEPGRALP